MPARTKRSGTTTRTQAKSGLEGSLAYIRLCRAALRLMKAGSAIIGTSSDETGIVLQVMGGRNHRRLIAPLVSVLSV